MARDAFIFKATIVACCPETSSTLLLVFFLQLRKVNRGGLGKSVCSRSKVGPVQKVTLDPEMGWVPQNYFSKKKQR